MTSPTTDALNTFGAILTFAAKLEETLQSFYAAATRVSRESALEQFADFEKKTGKRKNRLIAIRQENVTEMSLEPIEGLHITDYGLALTEPTNAAEATHQAITLETRAHQFYSDAGPKINVTEARRAFAKFAAETAERLEALQEMASRA